MRVSAFTKLAAVGAAAVFVLIAGCGGEDKPKAAGQNMGTGTPCTKWYAEAIAADKEVRNFTVSNADELAGLAAIVNGTWREEWPQSDNFSGKTVTLARNVDLARYAEGEGWVPIGGDKQFSGTFNGSGRVISNLTINRSNRSNQGLFGRVSRGRIENLGLDGVNLQGNSSTGSVAGTLEDSSSMAKCYSSGQVGGTGHLGGVAGSVQKSSVSNCYFTGVINSRGGSAVGGVAGSLDGNITDSYASAEIFGTLSDGVGGVAGLLNGSMTGCYSTGKVNGRNETGGVVGSFSRWGGESASSVAMSYSTGAVIGKDGVGGVIGSFVARENSSVTNCYSTDSVSGQKGVGGVAGIVAIRSTVSNSYSIGIVSGVEFVGGVAGRVSGNVTNCYSAGKVSGTGKATGGVAGLFGDWHGSTLANNAALNPEVTGDGKQVGRIAGRVESSQTASSESTRIVEANTAKRLPNNAAYAEITKNTEKTAWDAAPRDGEDITAAAIKSDGTISGRFTNENGWTTQNGKLPGLMGKTVAMPKHLR